MRFTCRTSTLRGIEALPVDVEVDVGSGLPSFSIVGLADVAVLEARERVRAAVRASGFTFPNARVVVNLAPGPLRKHGTGFDLPIAAAILAATAQVPTRPLEGCALVGELSLDGTVRPVPGMLAHALLARDAGPLIGSAQAAIPLELAGLDYRPLERLAHLSRSDVVPTPLLEPEAAPPLQPALPDMSEVFGHDLAKRALEVAAAGGHNVLMVGPPGGGKTMLARRLPGILPPLDDDERLATALVRSVAGIDESTALRGVRPFRAPHHSASVAGLVGGGSPPRPGEVSLAHNGVLFLDEMPEFGPASLQTLRQPLEDGRVVLVRADGRVMFPARFSLVGAANPCPCGFAGDPERACVCPPSVVARYGSRIGGPLMDRIDLCLKVGRVDPARVLDARPGETSAAMRERVALARAFAADAGRAATATLSGADLLAACRLDPQTRAAVESVARVHRLSGRGITRLLRVARSIADLDGKDAVTRDELAEAVAYRFDTEAGDVRAFA